MRERNIIVCCLSHGPHWGLAHNPGMCPNWESNQRPFGLQPALSQLSYTSQGRRFFDRTLDLRLMTSVLGCDARDAGQREGKD